MPLNIQMPVEPQINLKNDALPDVVAVAMLHVAEIAVNRTDVMFK